MKFAILALIFVSNAFSDEPAHVPVEKTYPEWHAVKRFHSEEGFQMKDAALKSMGVQFEALAGKGPWKIPESAVARVKYSNGVYRFYNGWISFVLVDVISRGGGEAFIKSLDLEPGDSVAVAGVTELRLTEADLTSDTVDSCSH